MAVNFQSVRETTLQVVKDDNYNYEQAELPEFRRYTRREIYRALGVSSADGVKNLVDKVESYLKDTTGDDIVIGHKDELTNKYTYSLSEIYLILSTIPNMDGLRATKNKIAQQFKAPKDKGAYVLGCANQKGGVGKTTFTICTSSGQALYNFERARILVIDLDPQGSLHNFFDGREINIRTVKTVSKYLYGTYEDDIKLSDNIEKKREFILNELIRPSMIDNLDYCPAFEDCNIVDTKLDRLLQSTENEAYHGEEVYKIFQQEVIDPIKHDYDIIIIDVPPKSCTTVHTALFALDHLIIPCPTHQMVFDSTVDFTNTFGKILEDNPELNHKGMQHMDVVKTMYQTGVISHQNVDSKINRAYPDNTYPYPLAHTATYNALAEDYYTIYSHASADEVNGLKSVRQDWDKLNDHVRRSIRTYWDQ